MHPLEGHELTIVKKYSETALLVETADGVPRVMPLAWTSLVPRPDPLTIGGRAVRLSPEGLRTLAPWVVAKIDRQKLASADREDQKPGDGLSDQLRADGTATAVVEQARAQQTQRRGRRKRGTR